MRMPGFPLVGLRSKTSLASDVQVTNDHHTSEAWWDARSTRRSPACFPRALKNCATPARPSRFWLPRTFSSRTPETRPLLDTGQSWRQIAAKLGLGVGTVRRACERRPNGRESAGVVKAFGAA